MEKEKLIATKEQLRNREAVYVLMSNATRMPYVVCDMQTYDDEILLYYTEEDARKQAITLAEEKIAVQITKVDKKDFLAFYNSLFPMGVNCILVHTEEGEALPVQLQELVLRPSDDMLPQGKERIENQAFHLTALYFMQQYRKEPLETVPEEMKELQEEMMTHYQEGKYLVAYKESEEKKDLLLLRQKDGTAFLPVFTDYFELRKFMTVNKIEPVKAAAVEASKIPEILTNEASGVAINPFGVNVQLKVERKQNSK